MAAITPGTGGTIKSASAEGQLQELAMYLHLAEATPVNNPAGVDNISVSHSPDTGSFGATFTIPVQQQLNGAGEVIYSANDYLTGLSFNAGSGGTFKNTSAAGYFIEIIIHTQNLERQPAKNSSNRNGVTGSFNLDNTVFSGSIDLPVEAAIQSDGSIKYTVQEYLLP